MLRFDNPAKSQTNPRTPIHLVALFDICQFSLLAFSSPQVNTTLVYIGLIMAFSIYLISFIISKFNMGDVYIFSIVAMLSSIGLIMQFRLSYDIGFKQFVWFIGGTVLFLAVSLIYSSIHEYLRDYRIYYTSIIIIFIVTLIFGVKVNGARNWIIINGYSFQPSEFIKILFVFLMSSSFIYMEKLKYKIKTFDIKPKLVLSIMIGTIILFFALQREFGTTLLIFMVYLSYLYVYDNGLIFLGANILISSICGLLAIKIVSHIQVRIDTWLDPFKNIDGTGYQITQSLFAIGTGGFFGTGIGLGHPYYIPNVETDFIYSAICEEMGIFGGIAVLLLYFLLVYRGVKISLRLKDDYNKALAFGLTAMLGFQTFIIIGGVTKLIPLTGITLPFISYGGSSLVASYITLGLLQALSGPILKEEVFGSEESISKH